MDLTEVRQIESAFQGLNRQPAFYFPAQPELEDFSKLLLEHGYSFKTSEVFMFHPGQNLPKLDAAKLKKVENTTDLEIFMQIFDDCYRLEDEKAGRGSGFNQCLQSTRADWERFHQHDRVEFFILYHENLPVGIVSLTNLGDMGYISNIGILPAHRGLGLGKLITLFGVEMSKKHGNKLHFLIAEQGAQPEKIYAKIGFVPQLVCDLLIKD